MSKIDWSQFYKQPLRGKRGKYSSYQELVKSQLKTLTEQQKVANDFKKIEPLLKSALLEHMVNRKPIKVMAPIQFHTEFMTKSETGSGFSFGLKTIPAGTELVFQHLEKTLGQFIFKSSSGEEFEIYQDPVITVPGAGGMMQQIPNVGFWGLLTRTSIYNDVMEAYANAGKAQE